SISDFVFYRKQKNQLVLQTEEPLTIFKAKYNITEGIAGEVFNSNGMCIYSKQLELAAIEPNWKDVGSVIGCRIGDEDIFFAVSNSEEAFNDELAEMLSILFKHTNEALKRIDYENLLKKKAVIDPLTNVYNRLYYNQAIKYEVKLAKRYKNDIGFIVIDINNLKKINDEYGHNRGDKALKFVADLLVSQARETDNVIRSGGDEFLVMLPQTGKEVKIVENRLRKKIVDFNKKSKLPFPVNFAIGSAFWNIELNKSTEEIIKEADNKMYIDKRNSAKSR
ncbi:MAG: GGDEF domain-containing protein, partial [Candidatus Cloacimonadota bacterium]|nr:GGDEF domain-containing protein [Candidatus Cloacimonadota bacterium]